MKKREEKSLSVSHSRRAFLVWVPASLLVTACGGDNGSSAPASIKKAIAALTGPGGATWTGMGKGGILIQSPYSGAGNFELLAGDEYGMLHCLRRTNDNGAQWMVAVGDGMGSKNSVSGYCHTYSTNYTNIEAAVVDDGAVKTYFRSNSTPWSAHKTIPIGDAQGFPAYLNRIATARSNSNWWWACAAAAWSIIGETTRTASRGSNRASSAAAR